MLTTILKLGFTCCADLIILVEHPLVPPCRPFSEAISDVLVNLLFDSSASLNLYCRSAILFIDAYIGG